MTCSARSRAPRRGSVPRAGASSGSSQRAAGRIRRSEQLASSAARSPAAEPVEAARGRAARSSGARHVQRPAPRLAPPHRDHARACGERVQPLRRRGEPGADDADLVARIRAARRRARRAGRRQLVGHARGPGCPVATQHVREAPVPVELEAAVDRRGSRSTRAARRLSSQPLARAHAPRRARGTRRPSGDSGRRRDATSGRSERRRRASRTASPGNVVGRQCPSLSERIARWRIAARAPPPGGRRIGSGAEDGDLVRLEPAAPQGLVRREAGQPAADDRDAGITSPSRRAAPARSSAGTRRRRRAGRRAR